MLPRKRVLFVNQSLKTGGIETIILDMIRLLPPDIFSPEVAVFDGGGILEKTLQKRGIPLHHLDKREGVDLGLVMRLRRLMLNRNITILHTHNFAAWLYGALAAKGIGGICHVHTEHSGVAASHVRFFAERWLSRITDHVIAVSGHVHEVMTKDIGIPPKRVKVILNGVDNARFKPDTTLRDQIRKELGVAQEEFVVGIVARLAPIKNHSLLLRAFAEFEYDLPKKKRLLIVGEGEDRAKLESLSRDLGIADRVQFLGDRRDTEALFRAMDVYVLCSVSEGMNLTLLEAMSSGLPVIATAVGGNVEIVEHGISGFLVALNKPIEMGQYIQRLSSDQQLRQTMGLAGRESVLKRFSDQTMMDQYLALYGFPIR